MMRLFGSFGVASLVLVLALVLMSPPHSWAAERSDDPATANDAAVKRELARWLESIHHGAGDARDFVLDQAPLVIRDIVAMGRVESMATMLFLLGISLFGCWLWRSVDRDESIKNDENAKGMLHFISFIIIIIPVIIGVFCFHTFVVAWFAPRIYVLEYAARLIGNASGH